jgi:hypothetical protein
LAALAAGIVDATPLDVAYIHEPKNSALIISFISAMSRTCVSAASPSTRTRSAQPGANVTSRPGYAEGTEVSENQQVGSAGDHMRLPQISGDYVEKIYQFALRSLKFSKEILAT